MYQSSRFTAGRSGQGDSLSRILSPSVSDSPAVLPSRPRAVMISMLLRRREREKKSVKLLSFSGLMFSILLRSSDNAMKTVIQRGGGGVVGGGVAWC